MNLKEHFSPRNWRTHIATLGLVVDGVNNVSQGNYQFAACEGIVAAYLQARKVLSTLREENITATEELVLRVQKASDRINPMLDQTIRNWSNLITGIKKNLGIEEIINPPISYTHIPSRMSYFKTS